MTRKLTAISGKGVAGGGLGDGGGGIWGEGGGLMRVLAGGPLNG